MNDNQITEVLPDGTIHHFDIDVCNKEAEEVMNQLWEKEGRVLSFDFTASVFSLFTDAIHILTNSGWSTRDLIQEIYTHSEADDNIGEEE